MTGLRKGRALAILWADVPSAQRADLEAWAASEPLAPADPEAGVLAVGRYAGMSGAPAFLEVHELLSDDAAGVAASGRAMSVTLRALERLGAAILSGGAPTEPGGSRTGSTSPAGVYGQIFPPGIDERAAVHGLPPALQIGRIDIPPAHEDEFNDWYNTEYRGVLGAALSKPRDRAPLPPRLRVRAHRGEPSAGLGPRSGPVGLAAPDRAPLGPRARLARHLPPPRRVLIDRTGGRAAE